MNLEERGLWISIYMEFWVNGSLPADTQSLAKLLGFTFEEIDRALGKLHYSFIDEVDGQLISKELEEYRLAFLEKREKQVLGGRQGAQKKKERQAAKLAEGQPSGSLNHINLSSVTSNQLINKEEVDSDFQKWVKEYNDTPDSTVEYLRASRG
jgi:uncharacterized protein YdaU (DUF1376 family)